MNHENWIFSVMGKRKNKFPIRLLQKSTKESKPRNGIQRDQKTTIAPDLQGSRFRWLNESLYTESSSTSFELFQKQPQLFDAYHNGFRSQASSWPSNPVEDICLYLQKECPKGTIVGDFGCGDAQISKTMNHDMTVHSFDLVSVNPLVTACNIAKVPLGGGVLDVAIFSLSLMGTDWPKFIAEAQRCLKKGGILYVAEVQSRVADFSLFCKAFQPGFKVVRTENTKDKYFVTVILKKVGNAQLTIDHSLLKPCYYKKR